MRVAFARAMSAAGALLETTENPLHRVMLENYRRHGMLEVSGRWKEILRPEMTVPEPVYTYSSRELSQTFTGAAAVGEMYRGLVATRSTVMVTEDERLSVADWGLTTESTFHQLMPGGVLRARFGDEFCIDEPGATYMFTRVEAMVWRYERGRLAGEHIDEDATSFRVAKCDPADVITMEEAAAVLAPRIRPVEEMAAMLRGCVER